MNKICSGCFLSLSAVLACSLLSCLPWPSDSLSGISFLVNPGFCISPYNFLYLLASLTNFSGMCSRARPLYFLGNRLLWRVENKWWEEARIVLQNFQLMKWAYVSTSRYIYKISALNNKSFSFTHTQAHCWSGRVDLLHAEPRGSRIKERWSWQSQFQREISTGSCILAQAVKCVVLKRHFHMANTHWTEGATWLTHLQWGQEDGETGIFGKQQ